MTATRSFPPGRHGNVVSGLLGMLAGAVVMAMTAMPLAGTLAELQSKLPTRIAGWQTEAEDRTFDERTIFSYIDGAGEVYRAYNMKMCLSRRYIKEAATVIILDIFDMGSAADAYGVFTHDTDGEKIDIGQDGRLRPGWLSFWQNRFFVSIYLEEENPAAEKAIQELGRQVAAAAGNAGKRPPILKLLPANGLDIGTVRYLHHPIVLNYHYYLFDENILLLSPRTDATLAAYSRSSEKARLLLISYPETQTAKDALAGFREYYLPDADKSGVARLENGKWSAVHLHDRLLAVVLESDSRQLAKNLLKEAGRSTSEE